EVSSGNYTGAITINKSLTINGPNAGTAGYATRVDEAVLENAAINVTGSVTVILDGLHIYQTNNTADAILLSGGATATVTNNIIERFGITTGNIVRGLTTSAGAGVKTISNNLFTGDP